jgi:hypothetical protein
LKDRALSVSGSYEKFFELNGARYSHVMDPRTGRPVQGVLSVAVVTDDGTSGDALDNVFYVLGAERVRSRLSKFPASEVIFFLPDSHKKWKMVRVQRLSGSKPDSRNLGAKRIVRLTKNTEDSCLKRPLQWKNGEGSMSPPGE